MSRDRARYEKRVGTVIEGKWRLDELLGWGSTSAVYAATHRNGHRAALKILHQSLCADTQVCERFLREARIANAIKHRSIVPIGDDGITAEGAAYLVIELLEGETLEARRERMNGRLELADLAPIAEELMSALAAVHAAGVVHRDLKPQNVFLTRSELKLLDFGTARIFDPKIGSQLSVQGLVIGTPAFMSPEQALGSRDEVDAQSDVWALGAMLFTVLSGEFVHVGRDAHARLLAAASRPARPLADVAPTIDERVAAVIDRALSYAKKDRWSDVQSMRVAFRAAVRASLAEPTVATAAPIVETPMDSVHPVGALESEAESTPALFSDRETDAGVETHAIEETRTFELPKPLVGGLVVAAAAALVVFAASVLDDAPSTTAPVSTPATAAIPDPPAPELAPPAAAAPSYIVITAPDLPTATPAAPAPKVTPSAQPAAVPAPATTSSAPDASASESAPDVELP